MPSGRDSSPGFVYLMRCHGRHKIGYSADPKSRLRTFRGHAYPVELLHAVSTDNMVWLEAALHQQYRNKRVHGEWFELSEDDVAAICRIERMDFVEGLLEEPQQHPLRFYNRELYFALKQYAAEQGMSLNATITALLKEALAREGYWSQ